MKRLVRSNVLVSSVILVAGVGGAAFGSLSSPESPGEDWAKLTSIQPYGQDTDGDGIATTKEGALDVDGDGRFGDAEMEQSGTGYYIRWAYPEDLDLVGGLAQSRTCAAACVSVGGTFGCRPNLDTVNCITVGNFCYSTGCAFPCACPID